MIICKRMNKICRNNIVYERGDMIYSLQVTHFKVKCVLNHINSSRTFSGANITY